VGTLGFLAHPDLSAENQNHTAGNYGLLDMIAGLQWVQKHIGAFGGDPLHAFYIDDGIVDSRGSPLL